MADSLLPLLAPWRESMFMYIARLSTDRLLSSTNPLASDCWLAIASELLAAVTARAMRLHFMCMGCSLVVIVAL
ncbi:hypothetical protein D3C86_2168380 [compost metagenome]